MKSAARSGFSARFLIVGACVSAACATGPDSSAELGDAAVTDGSHADVRHEDGQDSLSGTAPCGLLGVPCPAGFDCVPQQALIIANGITEWCYSTTERAVYVPPGTVWIGCNEAKRPDDCDSYWPLPQAEFRTSAFVMRQHSVTVAEYQECFEAGFPDCATARGPGTFLDMYALDSDPVAPSLAAAVSWFQAKAYCAWQSQQTGKPWRLCSTVEWEKALLGDCETLRPVMETKHLTCAEAARLWPWGDANPHADCALTYYSLACRNPLKFDPVGLRPGAASVYGVMDALDFLPMWMEDCSVVNSTSLPRDGTPDESCAQDGEPLRTLYGFGSPLAHGRNAGRATRTPRIDGWPLEFGTITCCRDF